MTLQRLKRALLSWNEGFSVVAPISVIVPFSTCGRKVSYKIQSSSDVICRLFNYEWSEWIGNEAVLLSQRNKSDKKGAHDNVWML